MMRREEFWSTFLSYTLSVVKLEGLKKRNLSTMFRRVQPEHFMSRGILRHGLKEVIWSCGS
jgi:hypothetical protein